MVDSPNAKVAQLNTPTEAAKNEPKKILAKAKGSVRSRAAEIHFFKTKITYCMIPKLANRKQTKVPDSKLAIFLPIY